MERNGPIVCATDLSPGGARAVDLAVIAGRDLGAPLRLVHATDTAGLGEAGGWVSPARKTLEERVRRRAAQLSSVLERERERAIAAGVEAEAGLVQGRPWEAVIAEAARVDARAIVVGPHGTSGPAGVMRAAALEWLLGITADRVVRHAPCPVLVASNQGAMAPLANGRWVAAVDFESPSRTALALALRTAAKCHASVTAVHALPALPELAPPAENDPWDPEAEETSARAHLEQIVADVRSRIPGAPPVACRVVRGDPVSATIELAGDLGATMITIGTHGRTGIAHGFLGSVAERLLRRATVPVLVTRG